MRHARRIAGVLAALAVVAAVLAGLSQLDATRRVAIAVIDPGTPVAAAAPPTVLRPTFDGPDLARPRIPVHLELVTADVPQPTDLAPIPGTDRWVVTSKSGTAWLVTPGQAPVRWFAIDVATTSELGLLGIAFHPRFTDNGRFYVNATPKLPDHDETQILRYHVSPRTVGSPGAPEPVREQVVLAVTQPFQNHNAGQIVFGPDGMLYVGLGDGGYRGDPHGNGQNLGTLLGSMLRLDVDAAEPYAVPPDNPFVGQVGARPEIWAYGLRNPWRFTFEPSTGRMIVADVGQDKIEEIDLVRRSDNLGWNVLEGYACYAPSTGCRTEGMVGPIWTYRHGPSGISVTGGVVWTAPGPLTDRYLFGDYGSGRLWAMAVPASGPATEVAALGRFTSAPTAFARAPDGTVWVADFAAGAVFRIVPD
ncbi:MAG: PQQ-dependent sugar dehydrogenase [Myxococcota bacterium]